jgi:hypothetical protein
MRRALPILLMALGLTGCNQFADWHQELDYLRRQATTTPAQYKRLLALEAQLREEQTAEVRRLEAQEQRAEERRALARANSFDGIYERLVAQDDRLPPAQRHTTDQLRQIAQATWEGRQRAK